MKWWGWGDPGHDPPLPDHAIDFLHEELGGIAAVPRRPVALEDVRLAEPSLPSGLRERLAEVVGPDGVRDDREARVLHAAGKGYVDLVRQRAGDCESAPDAVVFPRSGEEVAAVLAACAEAEVAVVPFGGGTSVVGGVEPLRNGFSAVVTLDLAGLDGLAALDERSLTAVLLGGTRLPDAERLLQARGLTLGHFPQSYEFATVGGCVAARSAGQASTGYGRIDEKVLGLDVVAPAGEISLPPRPASAAGPGLRELLVGSEGTLGVVVQAALRVHPRPMAQRFEGWLFRDFREGSEAFRTLVQAHAAPQVARLSDPDETRTGLALAGVRGLPMRVGGAVLRARGYGGGCLAILGWEGSSELVAARRARGAALLRRHGGRSLGTPPGKAWERSRYSTPYLRDDMIAHGVLVETLETATQWSNLHELHRAVGDALRESLSARGTPPLVLCHVSHLYESGASLYFTFMARQEEGAEVEQWQAAKRAATDAIVATGGTLTHHHAVGRDHVPWMRHEAGDAGLAALRAAKEALDPAGILNPGKLLPGAGSIG